MNILLLIPYLILLVSTVIGIIYAFKLLVMVIYYGTAWIIFQIAKLFGFKANTSAHNKTRNAVSESPHCTGWCDKCSRWPCYLTEKE